MSHDGPIIECSRGNLSYRLPLSAFRSVGPDSHPLTHDSVITYQDDDGLIASQVIPFSVDEVRRALVRARESLARSDNARTSGFVDLGDGTFVRPYRVDRVSGRVDDSCYVYMGGDGIAIKRPAAAVVADLERALRRESAQE